MTTPDVNQEVSSLEIVYDQTPQPCACNNGAVKPRLCVRYTVSTGEKCEYRNDLMDDFKFDIDMRPGERSVLMFWGFIPPKHPFTCLRASASYKAGSHLLFKYCDASGERRFEFNRNCKVWLNPKSAPSGESGYDISIVTPR